MPILWCLEKTPIVRYKGPVIESLLAVFTRPFQCTVTETSATDDNLNGIFPCYSVMAFPRDMLQHHDLWGSDLRKPHNP